MSMASLPNKTQVLQCQSNNPERDSNFQSIFKVQQLDTPTDLQGTECLVEIRAISLDVADIAALPLMRKGDVPGYDFAGVIRQCNSGMWNVGDRVAGFALGGVSSTIQGQGVKRYQPMGSCSQYVRTNCNLVFRIPDNVDFKEAATLPGSLATSYALFNLPSWPHQAESHESILVLGGDTTLGLSSIQLAHCMGYRVIAVGEQSHQKEIEKYGADNFFDRSSNELAQQIRDATSNKLRYAHVTTLMDNALELATQSMPQGGEISIDPLVLAQFGGAHANKDRGNVKIVQRTPVTQFGFDCEIDGRKFQPMQDETQNTYKFLQQVTKWVQDEKLQTLPSVDAQTQGINGLLDAMNQIKGDMERFMYKRLVSTISGRQGEEAM